MPNYGARTIAFDPDKAIPLLLEGFGLNSLEPDIPA
jgi:hypothetical protein